MLSAYFGRGIKLAVLAGLVGLAGVFSVSYLLPEEAPDQRSHDFHSRNLYQHYVARTEGVFGDVPGRIQELGIAPITWAYKRYGLIGAGLGTGSQGGQHFGAVAQGAAEGGLGKIWLELGAPGFFAAGLFAWALARHIWRVLKLVSKQSVRLSRISYGLVSFLLANVATFAVASQIYGDVFVLLMVGTALGLLLSMPVLCARELQSLGSVRPRYTNSTASGSAPAALARSPNPNR
jgi:hypothetical protein